MGKEWNPSTVFDVFGDERARRILALASERPRTAEGLADQLEVSQPTVYRRLTVLEDYDLLSQGRSVDSDGHHRKRYETRLDSVHVDVEDGEFAVHLELRHDVLDAVDDGDFAE